MHINREIEKTNKREKPKTIKNNKAIPLFLYPVEATIYRKSDTINEKRNILTGTPERAKYEMEVFLQKNNVLDYTISVTMPQGHHVDLIGEDAGKNIHGSFDPFIKADEKKAARQKRLDLAAASRASKIDRSLDGLNQADENNKLETMHGKKRHII